METSEHGFFAKMYVVGEAIFVLVDVPFNDDFHIFA